MINICRKSFFYEQLKLGKGSFFEVPINPVIEFVEDFENQHRKGANLFCTVVLPVFVTRHRWEALLHNHSTYFLRSALRAKGTRIITTVGFYL